MRPSFKSQFCSILLLSALLLASPGALAGPLGADAYWHTLQKSPPAPLNALARSSDTSAAKPGIRLVLFWASWCPYCKKAQATYQVVQKRFASRGLKVLGYSVDADLSAARKHVDESSPTFAMSYAGDTLKDFVDTEILPMTLIVGPDDRVIATYSGYSGDIGNLVQKRLSVLYADAEEE